MKSLHPKLDGARIKGLLFGDQGFEKVKENIHFLYRELDLGKIYYFNVIKDVRFMEDIDLEKGQ